MLLPGNSVQFIPVTPQPRPIEPNKHNLMRGSSIPLIDPWNPISPRGSRAPQAFPSPLYTTNTPSNQSTKRLPTQADIHPQPVLTANTPTTVVQS